MVWGIVVALNSGLPSDSVVLVTLIAAEQSMGARMLVTLRFARGIPSALELDL